MSFLTKKRPLTCEWWIRISTSKVSMHILNTFYVNDFRIVKYQKLNFTIKTFLQVGLIKHIYKI